MDKKAIATEQGEYRCGSLALATAVTTVGPALAVYVNHKLSTKAEPKAKK